MKPISRQVMTLLSAATLAVLAGQNHQAWADDTEIYVAEPPPGANTAANIMFIIDTSGSMDGNVVTQASWDPNVDFDGSCRDDRIYWSTGAATAPVCSGNSATDNYIPVSAFLCQSAEAGMKTDGSISVNFGIQWRTSNNANNRRWEELQSGRRNDVDCKGDTAPAPADGRVANDGLYPTNGGSGPYSNVAQDDSWWTSNNRNRTYTFYTGNYLNYLRSGGTVTKTRIEVVKEVTIDTLNKLTNVNVGLTIFNNNQGGRVIYPVSPIATSREPIKTLVTGLTADGFTPLSETLYEVFQYWAGRTPRYSGSATNTRVGGTGAFISPLGTETCAKNYNVLLTDGEPTEDTDVNTLVPALPGFVGTGTPTTSCSNNSTGGSNGRCLDDIAKYMFDQDLHATTSVKDSVITYTVGFGEDVTGSTTLAATAAAGGGTAYDASDTASLTDVFQTIIREIISQDSSFTAPAVSVNAFNRTQNLSDLYFTVFEPSENLHWAGNLKKYRVGPNGTIIDADNRNAVDAASGFFSDSARSFWSTNVDGSNVELGGAASNLPTPANRNVYTDLAALTAAKPASLTTGGNSVSLANSLPLVGQITPSTLGLPALDLIGMETLIQWIRGGNVDNSLPLEPRRAMGDPLHARPVSVIYGGTEATPDTVVYTATNDGYLHAIDANGYGPTDPGQELWTYIPSELLSRMASLRENDSVTAKGYALDGNLVAHRTDINNDGIIDPNSCTGSGASQVCDRVLLFFGMGRGGRNYYALDVTDKHTPKLLWRKGSDDALIGAGQTWSTPVITRINVSGATQNTRKLVMVVGGGYDATQDNIPYNVDNVGNRVFILDAISGDLLWHAGPTNVAGLGYDATANFKHAKLTHSVPADIRAIDLTGDGFADRLYTADTGGRIWRFDVANGSTATNLITGGVLASLGNADEGSHPTASARRFYNAPDPALIRVDGKAMLNLSIGSGTRGHPLNTEIQDRFYGIRDKQVFLNLSQSSFDALTPVTDGASGLIDVTGVANPSVPASALGWKLLLNQPSWQGEKVLTDSLTFDGNVLFSSFTPIPSAQAASSCTVSGVKNTFYSINVANGKVETRTDLMQAGIAPRPVILFTARTDNTPPTTDPNDSDGDGIPDSTDTTHNCQVGVRTCTPGSPEGDPDGDGIPNKDDTDDDGDGTPDNQDDDDGGDDSGDGDDGIRCYIGREGCPVDLDNPLTRTFWTQQNVDAN